MVNKHLKDANDAVDLLRSQILRKDPKNAALRASFREITSHLESIQQQKPVSSDDFRTLVSWLSTFLDAEFGTLISRYAELNKHDREALVTHINERKHVVMQAEQVVPQLQAALGTCLSILNKSPAAGDGLDKQARFLASLLKKHMQDDEVVRKAFNALIAAMQESFESISEMLSDMGEDSPELSETQNLLNQKLPDDPQAAKAILLSARNSILEAGKRVSSAGRSIQKVLEKQKNQMQEMSVQMNAAEFEAQHDQLTGLGNRRKLAAFIKNLSGQSTAFLMLDIDHFKKINDRYGHDAGDEILAELGNILAENIRSTDIAVRLGGEEFGAVLTNLMPEKAFDIAETLRQAVCACGLKHRKGKLSVTVSIGLAMRKPNENIAHWIMRSDKALYQAKHNGRNKTEVSLE